MEEILKKSFITKHSLVDKRTREILNEMSDYRLVEIEKLGTNSQDFILVLLILSKRKSNEN